MSNLETLIDDYFEKRGEINSQNADKELKDAVNKVLAGLDAGELRVAEKKNGTWVVNQWIKKAVLLSFTINDNIVIQGGYTTYFDKVPLKFGHYDKGHYREIQARVVPPATARYGSFIEPTVAQVSTMVPAST